MPSTRRELLHALSVVVPSVVAGCSTGDAPSATAADHPPSRTGSQTSTPTDVVALSPDVIDFELDVRVLQEFTAEHPARLEIAFTNASELPFVGLDGPEYVLPFVDDDYAGEAADGTLELFIVPDDARLHVNPEGPGNGWAGEMLPESPTDGCWVLPFDWPEARGHNTAILNAVTVDPDETIRHGYTLYFIDGCVTGTFAFVNRFDIQLGTAATPGGPAYPTTVGFDLTIPEAGDISAEVHEPSVETPPEKS